MPPLVCLPTTAGSAADVSQFVILNDANAGGKFAIIGKPLVPDAAIIDSSLLRTCPPAQRAASGIDVFAHALEAFFSNGGSDLTEIHALRALETTFHYLPAWHHAPDAEDLADEMMNASLHAGLAFSNASLGAIHALAHALGSLTDRPHGECVAAFLPTVLEANLAAVPHRLYALCRALGLRFSRQGVQRGTALLADEFRRFRAQLGLGAGLAAFGLDAASISRLARQAADDPCLLTSPRQYSADELEQICVAAAA